MSPSDPAAHRLLQIPQDTPFSVFWPDGADVREVSYRPASDQHWPSLRLTFPMPGFDNSEAEVVVKQWVNDWWPPTCPDLNLRDKGRVWWVPAESDVRRAAGPTWWVAGQDHHGVAGLAGHLWGTNVEVRLPDGLLLDHPAVPRLLSRLTLVRRGSPSWLARSYHPHRDVPDRGWGDGLVTGLEWAPWLEAPEHPRCPAPDLLRPDALPREWRPDATGARENRRIGHVERQWVAVETRRGEPVVWARAVPMMTRHPHPLLHRADGRYRLEWEETPVGWAGSLDPRYGHHVVLLERGELRLEVWFGLHADLDRRQAAIMADRLFP